MIGIVNYFLGVNDRRIPAITFPTDFLEKEYKITAKESLPHFGDERTEESDQTTVIGNAKKKRFYVKHSLNNIASGNVFICWC